MTRTVRPPSERIAVVGMACHYPDARSPERLWENVVAGRKAFRRIPPERLRIEDYDAATAGDADSIACTEAALLHDWEFDRVGFRVAGGSFRAADLTHWLALDVASRALADAGFPGAEGLPKDGTGVLVGNSLTGEFSRAQILRLRWPYVRRTLGAALTEEGWSPEGAGELLDRLESRYKEPFDPPGEETLAGGLANTIAGRICNHFDLGGGGYTVDGACASSLLAIANSCSALVAGDLDVALAGGVDLSLDPFELVGFSRTGALSDGEMRVFDRHSQGFLPGEGSGVVVLMRLDEALARGCRVLAVIAGWGISSDGGGGLTRPESDGQLRALTRAYERAGFGPDDVALFEAHGTGTPVGDAAELAALSRLRRSAGARSPAAVGSIKALIGHTKAAAGVAGTIKTVQALRHEILPPTFGCETPHPILVEGLDGDGPPALRIVRRSEPWPTGQPRRAGVSAMGFGGINSHLVLEAAVPQQGARGRARAGRRAEPARREPIERLLDRSPQEAELLVLSAADASDLAERARTLADEAEDLSRAELTDLAGELSEAVSEAASERPVRCAVVARTPREAARRLRRAAARLSGERPGSRADGGSSPGPNPSAGLDPALNPSKGVLIGRTAPRPRIGLLFPGQGAPLHRGGGAWTRRFEEAEEVYRHDAAITPEHYEGGDTSTAIAQPEIVKASLAGLALLERLGVEASVAIGHSLGELAALHWAGSLSDRELVRIADARGRVMEESAPPGAMISLRCAASEVERLLDAVAGGGIAAINGSEEVVVSGPPEAVDTIAERARRERIPVARLRVSRAFHSPSMERVVPGLGRAFDEILTPASRRSFRPAAGRSVVSTVTGTLLEPGHDLSELLLEQLTRPVRFSEALVAAADVAGPVDLWLEVGPGRVLSRLTAQCDAAPAIPLDAGGPGTAGLLTAAGALFCLGAPVSPAALFRDRFLRPVRRDRRLLRNPCERAPSPEAAPPSRSSQPTRLARGTGATGTPEAEPLRPPARPDPEAADPVGIVRRLVSSQTELPVESLADGDRMLSDLHLNSIAVGQLVVEAARRMGATLPADPTDYADASVAEIAAALRRLVEENGDSGARPRRPQGPPPGVESWVRPFSVELVDRELRELRDSPGSDLPGAFTLIAPEGLQAAEQLRERLGPGAGSGAAAVVVWLPNDFEWPADRRAIDRLLDGARAALTERTAPFVLVVPVPAGDRHAAERRGVGAAFARCLHLERQQGSVTVVQVPSDHRDAAAWVAAEIRNARDGYSEAVYDATGRRRVPVLRLVEPGGRAEPAERAVPGEPELPLGTEDVLLVSGGGRGIAAECALALARATGASLALLGRSLPEESPELAANLERLATAGVRFHYRPADVTDPGEVATAVADLSRELGPVTALLHGAGINEPRLIPGLDPERMAATRRPKVDGLARLLETVDADRLRLLIAFGSIIARTGMPGEADYALANEELAVAVEGFAAEHPACRCHTVEWSVWSGVGMGERLSSVEGLSAQGISAIPTDRGVAALQDLLSHPEAPVSVVIAGRYGDPPTLGIDAPELPLLRFLERPRLHVPGVELVVDTVLDGSSDPYVADHALDGEPLLPAVMGLEAIAQAATALEGGERAGDRPLFERVELLRPIVVPEDGTTLRVAVLRLAPGRFAAVVRSSYTGFQSDHFRALCRLRPPAPDAASDERALPAGEAGAESAEPALDLDPARDLYGGVMFHAGRFRRLRAYRRLSATDCLADIAPDTSGPWFARQLPDRLLLGDPAARDASLHAIQACIPHATVLPIGVERLETGALDPGSAHSVEARERSREGKTLVYDLVIRDAAGRPVERWQGLTLRIVAPRNGTGPWPRALLAPYLERRVGDLFGENAVSVAVAAEEPSNGSGDPAVRRRASDRAARELLARTNGGSLVLRRPDGKPEIPGGPGVSMTHGAGFALAVAAERGLLGCDAEPVLPEESRPWPDLLGPVRSELAAGVARETNGDPEVGFTRIWTALECLKKAGLPRDAPLTLERVTDDGWVLLRSGPALVATGLIRSSRDETSQVVALLWGAADGHPVPDKAGEQLGRGGDELPPG